MGKELKTKRMKALLAKGVRKAKRNPKQRPGDGMMTNLVHLTLKNGWHYQVEWVHDTRFADKPWVIAYAFPPHHSGIADYYLMEPNCA